MAEKRNEKRSAKIMPKNSLSEIVQKDGSLPKTLRGLPVVYIDSQGD